MSEQMTQMRREIDEIPDAVERLLTHGGAAVAEVCAACDLSRTRFLLSVARGSSDHACTYLKYASELMLGLPMASVGPSIASVYGAELKVEGALCLAVSQSGMSPDIVRLTESFGRCGAHTVAITNDAASPLAAVASATLPIHAGPEISVAATKTFVTSLVAGLWLLAELKRDAAVIAALKNLPEQLRRATRCDWSAAAATIAGDSLFTLGRGISWAIANEAALKFKETCRIHAESFSSAEVLHGPVALVERAFPVIAFAAGDAAENAVVGVADALAGMGAEVFVTSDRCRRAHALPHVRTDHWLTDPVAAIVSFYALAEQVARARGESPDRPQHLRKVTETL